MVGQPYDTIVVGGGHNGLTTACYLARAGQRVLVLESRPIVGGFCTTEETVPEAPGFRMNPSAIDLVMANIPRTIVQDLSLESFGLRWVHPDPGYAFLHGDGASICFWRDLGRTAAEFRRFSRRDAEQYERLVTVMRGVWKMGLPYLQGHPNRLSLATTGATLHQLLREHRQLRTGVRLLLQSPDEIIESWFEHEVVQTALAAWAAGGSSPLDQAGSGFILSIAAVIHTWGVRRAVGGMGAFTGSLAACLGAHGGDIRTATAVNRLILHGDGARGVETATGETLWAKQIVAAVDPVTLFEKLVAEEDRPADVFRELRGVSVWRSNLTPFKGDVALNSRPQLVRHGTPNSTATNDALLASNMIFANSLEAVRASQRRSAAGELSEEGPLWIVVPSVIDRTLVPPGSDGETVYVFAPSAPCALADGREWANEKDKFLAQWMQVFETFAPGTLDSVIGATATSPDDYSNFSHVHRGNFYHVDMSLSQMGPWRPTPTLAGYRTPIPRLWHTGAGSHPFGLIHGWAGRSAAREILRQSA